MVNRLQINAVHKQDKQNLIWDHSELLGQHSCHQLFPPSSHIRSMPPLQLQFWERAYCTAARMTHMTFGMRAWNNKGQDIYRLLALHFKHVSVWLLFFYPFFLISTLPKTSSGNRSSHYDRGWFNKKGFISSGHGWVDSLVPHTHLLIGGWYLNVQWYATMIALRASSSNIPLPLKVGEYPAAARQWVWEPQEPTKCHLCKTTLQAELQSYYAKWDFC